MRNSRRKVLSEINLTPLLDVLFSILFIVMMAGQGLQGDYQEQVSQLEQENAELTEQLSNAEEQMQTYDKFQSEAVILTINNTEKDGEHYLNIYKGMEKESLEKIQMGLNKTENTKARIEGIIKDCIANSDNQPVYVVFYCDKKVIYRTEYTAIEEVFNNLQGNNKEVFYKTMEAEDE